MVKKTTHTIHYTHTRTHTHTHTYTYGILVYRSIQRGLSLNRPSTLFATLLVSCTYVVCFVCVSVAVSVFLVFPFYFFFFTACFSLEFSAIAITFVDCMWQKGNASNTADVIGTQLTATRTTTPATTIARQLDTVTTDWQQN